MPDFPERDGFGIATHLEYRPGRHGFDHTVSTVVVPGHGIAQTTGGAGLVAAMVRGVL